MVYAKIASEIVRFVVILHRVSSVLMDFICLKIIPIVVFLIVQEDISKIMKMNVDYVKMDA